MKFRQIYQVLKKLPGAAIGSPGSASIDVATLPERLRGIECVRTWQEPRHGDASASNAQSANPLREYFDGVVTGPGIWKWLHYFEVYDRHLAKFRGGPVTVVEIGVFSGGSMPMWRKYFGDQCQIHGVDIQPDCKSYENEHTKIHIGDQADRGFWKRFREDVGGIDVLIDDGGHTPEQQMVTLEETLPFMKPGGVFICEDVHGFRNPFANYVGSLSCGLNAFISDGDDRILGARATPFQKAIHSIHMYPYMAVIEKHNHPPETFKAPKHGTEWQPFYAATSRGAVAEIPLESQVVE